MSRNDAASSTVKFEAFLIESLATAIRNSHHLIRTRRLAGLIPYTHAEEIGLFTTSLRSIFSGEYARLSHKALFEKLADASNYEAIGKPKPLRDFIWRYQGTLEDGTGWTMHAAKVAELLKAAREQAEAVGYDEDEEMKGVQAIIAGVRASLPQLSAMVTELEVLNRQDDEIHRRLAAAIATPN